MKITTRKVKIGWFEGWSVVLLDGIAIYKLTYYFLTSCYSSRKFG